MRKGCLVALAVLLLSSQLFSYAQGNRSAEEEQKIRQVVLDYVLAWETSDAEKMKQVLHPQARLFLSAQDGHVVSQSPSQLYAIFESNAHQRRDAPPIPTGDLKLVTVDVTDGIAAVKLEISYPGRKVTQNLSLMKLGGGWKVVSRVLAVQGAQAQAKLN